jgi:integrase
MKISEFFEKEYVPTYLADDVDETIKCYRTSVKKLKEHCGDPTIYEVNLHGTEFVRKLRNEKLQNATIAKHCRQLNSIFLKLGPSGRRNRDAKGLLTYVPYFRPPKVREKSPRVFTDDNFRSLFDAFNSETDFPKYLPPEKRPLFWQAVIVFVSITAVRREVVLGIEWCDINREELSVHVRPEIDKKDKNRIKPIKPILIEYLELIRPPHVNWNSNTKIFQWKHGDGCWYECWHNAEERAEIKMGLHDLKRFSGDLAIRAGASDLELMEHMDHASLDITLKHYCRPKTRNMVDKIVVPIPNQVINPCPPTSPNQAPEPPTPIKKKFRRISTAPAFRFSDPDDYNNFCEKEICRIEYALEKKLPVLPTSNGTLLSLYDPKKKPEKKDVSNNNNSPSNGNSAG